MPKIRLLCAPALLVAIALAPGTGRPARAQSSLDVIESYGLKRTRVYFVIPEKEEAIDEKLAAILPIIDNLRALRDIWYANEVLKEEIQWLRDDRVARQARIGVLRDELARLPGGIKYQAARDAYNQELISLDEMQILNQQQLTHRLDRLGSPQQVAAHVAKFEEQKALCLQAHGELRPVYTEARDAYRKLGEDKELKNAMTVYGREKRVSYRLGPTDDIEKRMKTVNQMLNDLTPPSGRRKPVLFKGKKAPKAVTKPAQPKAGTTPDDPA